VPSIERRPSPRDALSDARLEPSPAPWLCCPDHRLSPPLQPARRPCDHLAGLGPRPRAPLPAGNASRGLGVVRRLLQPLRHAGTPCEPSFLAREWDLRPATRRHRRMPVALALPTALPRRRPASRDPYVPHLRGARSACAEGRVTGRGDRAKARRTLLTRSYGPSSCRSEHPGHRLDWPRGLDCPAGRRSGRGPPRTPPREGRRRWKDRGAFRRAGTLTQASDFSLTRAWTRPPSRRLRRGIARGVLRLWCRRSAPSSDEESAVRRLDVSLQTGYRSSGSGDASQRPSRLLRPNQLAGSL